MIEMSDLPKEAIRAIRKNLGENVAIGDDEKLIGQLGRAGFGHIFEGQETFEEEKPEEEPKETVADGPFNVFDVLGRD